MSRGWAVECNDAWKNLRTFCRAELFSTKAMESQAWVAEKKVMEMVRFLSTKEGEVVKVGEVVSAALFNTMTSIFMSRDFISFEDDDEDGGMKGGLVRKMVMTMVALNLDDFYPIFNGLCCYLDRLIVGASTAQCESCKKRCSGGGMPTVSSMIKSAKS